MSRIVLVLTDPPLPFGNAAARWFYVLLKGLVERGHAVTAFAINHEPEQDAQVAALFPAPAFDVRLYRPPRREGWWRKVETFLHPYSYPYGPELRRDLNAELARGFDVLHLEHLWSGWVGLKHADRSILNIHYLFDIDFSDKPARTSMEHLRRAMTHRGERVLLRHYPTITTLTDRLTERVRQISPRSAVTTVPLGLDLSLYPFDPDGPSASTPVVGLIGSFTWHPTVGAGVRLLERLWPEIHRRAPEARLQIVGRRAVAILGSLVKGDNITILQDVPDAIPYFRSIDVLLYAPTRGSGMKVKVLEAFALGVPVVTTFEGIEGLPAVDGLHAGIAEDDEGLIARTVELLRDPDRRVRQRLAARALVEAHCSPPATLDRLEAVYATLPSRPLASM
jgi:glycosyltransferase involved in cell wall biosynthesis